MYNPSYEELYQAEMSAKNKGFEKGAVTESGAVAVKTGVLLEDLLKIDIYRKR